jgi:hypothetical protein
MSWSRRGFLRSSSLAVIGGIFVPKYERWFRPIVVAQPGEVKWYAALFSTDGAMLAKVPAQRVGDHFENTFPIHIGGPVTVNRAGIVDRHGEMLYEAPLHFTKTLVSGDMAKLNLSITEE